MTMRALARHSGMECRNPDATDGKLSVLHCASCAFPLASGERVTFLCSCKEKSPKESTSKPAHRRVLTKFLARGVQLPRRSMSLKVEALHRVLMWRSAINSRHSSVLAHRRRVLGITLRQNAVDHRNPA